MSDMKREVQWSQITVMNTLQLLVSSLGLSLLITPSVRAAMPPQEIYDFVMERYSLAVDQTRDGCTYYANPATLVIKERVRAISVLRTRGQGGGTACNGVFRFEVLAVDCQTGRVGYDERLGSPASWDVRLYEDTETARAICALSEP